MATAVWELLLLLLLLVVVVLLLVVVVVVVAAHGGGALGLVGGGVSQRLDAERGRAAHLGPALAQLAVPQARVGRLQPATCHGEGSDWVGLCVPLRLVR